jgi:HEAT repeat protein
MIPAMLRSSACILAALALWVTGCSEPAPKVDLNAQIAGLAGDADAKANALGEISKLGPDAAAVVPKILPLLKDADPLVRRTAAYTLGTIGPAAKAAVPDLKAMLQTDDRDQMTAVANALRAIDPASAPGFKVENVTN